MSDVLTIGDMYQWFDSMATLRIDAAGMLFFSELGFLEKGAAAIMPACSTRRFVYSLLPDGRFFDEKDWGSLEYIGECSQLAVFSSVSYEVSSVDVGLLAIDLLDVGAARSEEACRVLGAISKVESHPLVVLIRCLDAVVLGFVEHGGKDSVEIHLSDWISAATPDRGQVEKMGVAYCSLKSAFDLFDSLRFNSIRDYYKYPISRYVAIYDIVYGPINLDTQIDLSPLFREDLNGEVVTALSLYADQYGDDFIDGSVHKIEQDDDIDLDELEWQAEQLLEDVKDDENEGRLFDLPAIENEGDIDVSSMDVPASVMNDPIALLEWLEKHDDDEQSRKTNQSEGICGDERGVVPIGKTPPSVGSHLRHITLGEGVVSYVTYSLFDDSVLIGAEFGKKTRALTFPSAFLNGTVELLG